jgi:small-conductance mechanosensitive channel
MPVRRLISVGLVITAVTGTTGVAAQDTVSAQGRSAESAVELPTAPVVVDGATLFRVRGISSYPPERRAAEIAKRITEVAADRAIPVDSLKLQETPTATIVVANGRRIFGVLDADAELEGLSRQILAQAYLSRVSEAITAFRRDREASALWRDFARAAIATLAFLVLVALDRVTFKRVRTAVHARYRSKIHDVQVGSIEIVRGEHVWNLVQRAVWMVAAVVVLVGGYAYLNYVLLLFPWTRALGRSLADIFLQPLATLATGFIGFIPDLVFLVILAVVTRYVLKFVKLFFQRIADGSITLHGFDPEWARATYGITRFAVVAFALVIAYPYIPGSGSEAFKGIGLVLGLMFSLGSPSVIGNVVAGLGLAFRGAFHVGDRVRIGEHIGEVTQVRLLTTYLRSPKNEQVIIPNSMILNSEVVNYSALAKTTGLILHTNVGIGYETPWRQVEAMLLEAARRTPGLKTQPEPFVLHKKLGDFAVDYEINVFTDDAARILALYTALHRNILDVFNEYGVQIMTPAYEGDPEQAKIVPRDQWFTTPAVSPSSERVVEPSVPAGPADIGLAAQRPLSGTLASHDER